MARYADTPHGGGGGRKPKIFVLDTNIILHDHIADFRDIFYQLHTLLEADGRETVKTDHRLIT